MATIAIFVDTEEGHVLSTFWLSRHLMTCGYRVCYLGPPDVESIVRSQGFEFICILNEALLKRLRPDSPAAASVDGHAINLYFSRLVRGELLDSTIAELRPGAVLVNSLNALEGLAIHYRYRLPIIFFTPMLRRHSEKRESEQIIACLMELKSGLTEFLDLLAAAGEQIRNFRDVARLVGTIPELILLPEAFDLPGRGREPGVYYVGAGIDTGRKEQRFSWTGIDSNRPLIYCARGSQIEIQREVSRKLFQTTLDAAAARPEWQFIVATSKILKSEEFSAPPPNVMLLNWVPQFDVLSRSQVMINHGGFGTVKECIYLGVPMVVLPLKGLRDHSSCAERVVFHGLGVQSDDPQISPSELIQLIEEVLNNPSYKLRVERMRERLKQEDRLELAVKVIESAMAGANTRTDVEIDRA